MAARVKFLLVQSPAGIIISPLACLGISLAIATDAEFLRLLVWNFGMVLLALTRFVIWYHSPRKEQTPSNPRLWEWLLGGTMVAVALWWGLGGIYVMPGTAMGDMLVFCGVMMMAGGTSALYSVHPIAASISVVCLVMPVSFYLALVQPLTALRFVGMGSPLFVVGVLRGVQTLNHYLVRSHQLTYDLAENVKLLERSEDMRKDLTLMLVHDLRTPLSALITHAHLAREYTEEGDAEESMAEILKTADLAQSLVQMVSSILDVNRLESDQLPLVMSAVTLEELVEISLESLPSTGVSIAAEGDTQTEIECDVELISRVITNLLGNALRYQPEEEPIKVVVAPHGQEVEVRIVDRGPGVPTEDQTKIFDKYTQSSMTARRYTSGLGLTFCKMAVERHGGSIGVGDNPEGGSQFWFRLPLHHST